MTTPSCPGCGAKFSHDNKVMGCGKCGLPDEIASLGSQMILRWQKNKYRAVSPKRVAKQLMRRHPASAGRKRRKHGRPV